MEDIPFDLRRHFRELFRLFLPIFVVIGAVMIIVFVGIMPGERGDAWTPDATKGRVGLMATEPDSPFDPAFAAVRPVEMARAPVAVRFDAPMGSPLGALTYNAQPFLTSRHLGDDLNGIGGQDSDLGDPVYATAAGEVMYAGWPGDGWGNVVILQHRLPGGEGLQSLYGHLERIRVTVGNRVDRGDRIGTVGKADGRYLAHLHFEMRAIPSLDAGGGYADAALGRLSGEAFILKKRGAPEALQNGPPQAVELEREMPEIRFSIPDPDPKKG